MNQLIVVFSIQSTVYRLEIMLCYLSAYDLLTMLSQSLTAEEGDRHKCLRYSLLGMLGPP